MKVVFPCTGSLVLLKQDLETLKAFYNTNLLTSKLVETYKSSNVTVQVGNFNYIPRKSSLVLYKANVLTIEKMRKILGIYKEPAVQPATQEETQEKTQANVEEKISDKDILSNPFFQTLTQLN